MMEYLNKNLAEAIYLVALDPNKKEKVSKGLYPEVAQRFNTTVSSVDKGMGRAIKSAWELADESVKRRYFGKITSSKEQYPTAKLFIAVLASKII
jgi:two-component system response regulator (stage 0 sporulation protein A)